MFLLLEGSEEKITTLEGFDLPTEWQKLAASSTAKNPTIHFVECVFANFRDKNRAFAIFCEKKRAFANFGDKKHVFANFRAKNVVFANFHNKKEIFVFV